MACSQIETEVTDREHMHNVWCLRRALRRKSFKLPLCHARCDCNFFYPLDLSTVLILWSCVSLSVRVHVPINAALIFENFLTEFFPKYSCSAILCESSSIHQSHLIIFNKHSILIRHFSSIFVLVWEILIELALIYLSSQHHFVQKIWCFHNLCSPARSWVKKSRAYVRSSRKRFAAPATNFSISAIKSSRFVTFSSDVVLITWWGLSLVAVWKWLCQSDELAEWIYVYLWASQAVPFLTGCPACLRNYLDLFCEIACSPNQNLFLDVTDVHNVSSPCSASLILFTVCAFWTR